ncbi:hypothetical protein F5Y08DRAFT_143776 [Xylaria arbuscula]|nr:hypothetical protein F5Y08DRAFT_143776 [Xylaria arbuscula]
MSSAGGSTYYTGSSGSSGHSSTVINESTFRSHKSENYKGTSIERERLHGRTTKTINHRTGGYEHGAPTPSYGQSTSYGKTN